MEFSCEHIFQKYTSLRGNFNDIEKKSVLELELTNILDKYTEFLEFSNLVDPDKLVIRREIADELGAEFVATINQYGYTFVTIDSKTHVYNHTHKDFSKKYRNGFENGKFVGGLGIYGTRNTRTYCIVDQNNKSIMDSLTYEPGITMDESGVFHISYDGHKTLLNWFGESIGDGVYSQSFPFINDVGCVLKGNNFYFIKNIVEKEEIVPIPWELIDVKPFSEGYYCVKNSSNTYGFLDENLKLLHEEKEFYDAERFIKGQAIVAEKQDEYYVMDKKGHPVKTHIVEGKEVPVTYAKIRRMIETDFFIVQKEKDGPEFVVDKMLNPLYQGKSFPKIRQVYPNGLIHIIEKDEDGRGLHMLIQSDGSIFLEKTFVNSPKVYSDSVYFEEDGFGYYYNLDGTPIFNERFKIDRQYDLNKTMVPLQMGGEGRKIWRRYLLKRDGTLFDEKGQEYTQILEDGLMLVSDDNIEYYIVDKDGKRMLDGRVFEKLHTFKYSENILQFTEANTGITYCYDVKNDEIIYQTEEKIGEFKNGVAKLYAKSTNEFLDYITKFGDSFNSR